MKLHFFSFLKVKEFFELYYWKYKKTKEKQLGNSHYKFFFTTYFSLDEKFYRDKTVLDIGCGPRGSLEWANMAKERIGLDPLADKYLKLGAENHQMTYVNGYIEDIPFENEYFDIISSFNSLDHVVDIESACNEIKRVLKKGGTFILVVDIHRYPTFTEPHCLKWNFVSNYFGDFEIVEEKYLQNEFNGRIYDNLRLNKKLSHTNNRSGVLVARLKKK